MSNSNKIRFYEIDINYLKHLYQFDTQIYYSQTYTDKTSKPYIGIIIFQEGIKYFIPLSSPKPKLSKAKNISKDQILIYEIINNNQIQKNMILKNFSPEQKLNILSKIDIKKMIPVNDNCFKMIDFNEIKDLKYKKLLEKEYQFCLKMFDKIYEKAQETYDYQKRTNIVRNNHCNYQLLEKVMKKY